MSEKKVKATNNTAKKTVSKNREIKDISSEELGLLFEQNYNTAIQAEKTVTAIRTELQSRIKAMAQPETE